MGRLYNDGNALRLENLGKGEGYLFREPFLHLEPAAEHLGDSGELGKPDHLLVGDVANMHLFGVKMLAQTKGCFCVPVQ